MGNRERKTGVGARPARQKPLSVKRLLVDNRSMSQPDSPPEIPVPLLVSSVWLAQHLGEPDLRIVDASWYLPAAERDPQAEFAAGHIPGAVHLDLSSDLADPDAPVRNTLASPEALGARFARAGIGTEHHVVVYDRLGGFSAGRVWWSLRCAGHRRTSLLDGGLQAWTLDEQPLSNRAAEHAPGKFEVDPQPQLLSDLSQVLESLPDRSLQIVDARSAARFCGEGPEPARHRGHIPGSLNVPYNANLQGDPPRFKDLESLRQTYERAGVRFDRPIVTTCGSGVTASLNAFVLTLLGHRDVSVYDGSWAEWGNRDDVPVARDQE